MNCRLNGRDGTRRAVEVVGEGEAHGGERVREIGRGGEGVRGSGERWGKGRIEPCGEEEGAAGPR